MRASTPTPTARMARWARAAILIGCAASWGSASALSTFTIDAGRTSPVVFGTPFTADNLLGGTYSAVTLSGASFSEIGSLEIAGAQLGGATFTPGGLNGNGINRNSGLFIEYTGTGNLAPGGSAAGAELGSYTTFDYTLYGYVGPGEFRFSGDAPVAITSNRVALATGTLARGAAPTPSTGGNAFSPSDAYLSFVPTERALTSNFFAAPVPFYDLAIASFAATEAQVESFDGGFRVRQGTGSISFAGAAPEPETWALLLAGLGATALARRRRSAA